MKTNSKQFPVAPVGSLVLIILWFLSGVKSRLLSCHLRPVMENGF